MRTQSRGSYVTSVPPRSVLLEWAERSATSDRPALIVWAAEDRMMPRRTPFPTNAPIAPAPRADRGR